VTILGVETSCDETSAAVIQGGKLLSNVVSAQLFHQEFGGVVPELASRAHQRLIVPVVEEALAKAGVERNDVDGIAAVYGPGLIGSLLVGLSFSKAMAMGLGLPFIGVNHMEAHIFSNLIEEPTPAFPFVNLTVSGGHTQLVLVKNFFDYELLGETIDDAAGEAFDKVAKMLGLGYPGGPNVDAKAKLGNPKAIQFPRPYLEGRPHHFSFSGIKTAVLYYLKREGLQGTLIQENRLSDICASFQSAVVEVLVHKLISAAGQHSVENIAIAGGVSANTELRSSAQRAAEQHGLNLFIPRFEFCTDNGAMVAMVGYEKFRAGKFSHFELTVQPNLSLVI